MKEFWDQRYSGEDFVYGRSPNRFFAEQLILTEPGLLLLPCEGEGRNAVFAASKGWNVHAFDQSTMGHEKALKLAVEMNVFFRYEIADAEDFDPAMQRYDAIGLVYAHFSPAHREKIHRKLASFLKPGGLIILEAFSKEQLSFTSGGPRDPEMLYDTEFLKSDFTGLEILHLGQHEIMVEEGTFHRGTASVVRMLAKSPVP